MSIQRFYEKYWQSPDNDPDRGQLVQQRKEKLKAELSGLEPSAKVAGLGCGIGAFTKYLCDLGYDATGVDISEASINHARQIYPDLKFEAASLEDRLTLPSAKFDAVW